MGETFSCPCADREDDKSAVTEETRPSRFVDSPLYYTTAQIRLALLRTDVIDSFFQSSVKEQLLHKYIPLFLTQFPGTEETAFLLCRLQDSEDLERYTTVPFSFFGKEGEQDKILEFALKNYQRIQRLEPMGAARVDNGLYFLFRVNGYDRRQISVREIPREYTGLQLEEYLNHEVSGDFFFRFCVTMEKVSFLVLKKRRFAMTGRYVVLEAGGTGHELMRNTANRIEESLSNSRMRLVGLVSGLGSPGVLIIFLYT